MAGALIGYARVSTEDQAHDLQLDELGQAGCERIFTDTASGTVEKRPELDRVLDHLRERDTLVVWRLDRLGRSIRHLIEVVTDLDRRGVGFRSLREGFDTTTPGGRLIFHVFAALAQFEAELVSERTKAGLAAARARGRKGGRKPALSPIGVGQAKAMYAGGELSVTEIAETLGVSRATIYRALAGNERGESEAA